MGATLLAFLFCEGYFLPGCDSSVHLPVFLSSPTSQLHKETLHTQHEARTPDFQWKS